jgi:hypothetical protein
MKVKGDISDLKKTTPAEYAIRFLFGGLVAVTAGLIAHRYGPQVGGLFLAFPAIFPASATLIDKHERKKEEDGGCDGAGNGARAAGADAVGAAIGSIGLVGFAIVVMITANRFPILECLSLAFAVWAVVSGFVWCLRQKL